MTAISGLTISDEKANGKVYYEPAVLTVKGQSQYNDDQISFEEIQGFWQLPDQFSGDKRPPQGTVAKFNLSTNPKKGPNARPGSMYQDITGIYAAGGEQPIAAQQQPQTQAPSEAWAGDEPASALAKNVISTPAGDYYMSPKDYQYIEGVTGSQERDRKVAAWNGLTAILAGTQQAVSSPFGEEQLAELWTEWHEGYALLKAGKTPFTSEPEPAVDSEQAIECAHDNAMGKVPPSGGFKPGEMTMHCQDCDTDFGEASDDNFKVAEDVVDMPW